VITWVISYIFDSCIFGITSNVKTKAK